MHQPFTVNYLNLLFSVSDAIDLVSPSLAQHQIRTAFICGEMAKVAQLPASELDDLFVAALLHDIGALSPEEKVNLHQAEVGNPERHCLLGEKLLAGVPGYSRIANIVRYHHTPWRCLEALPANDVVLIKILNLADHVERVIDRNRFILHQVDEILAQVNRLAEGMSSEIALLFHAVAVREDFWLDIVFQHSHNMCSRYPCQNQLLDLPVLKAFAELYRNMIDFRSHFTATHSAGVAASAVALTRYVGMTEFECEMMEIAGNLHDLGKFAIPNNILMKPAKLTPAEFAIVRQHTYFTYSVLMSIGGIQPIAEWAAFHHEHLNGQGYPFHISAQYLSMGSRIMAVADMLTALAENRPYRAGLSQTQVLSIVRHQVDEGALDARLVDILQRHYSDIINHMRQTQQHAQEYYDTEFAELVMRKAA